VQKALEDLRQGLLYGFWIVHRYGLEPALAGALGNSLGVALVLAVMKVAEAQSAAGWALAAGTVFVLVLAFGCVGNGHRALVSFWSLSATPPPLLFANYSAISGFAGFRPQFRADKGFRSSSHRAHRMEPVAWSLISFGARFMMFEVWDVCKWRCHIVGVEKLTFCFAARVS
jgi:hypothetical protein